MSGLNLQKHFEAADKQKSGLIDSEGLQSMINSIGNCDAFLASQFAHAIHNSKEQKVSAAHSHITSHTFVLQCSLAELQSIVDSCSKKPPANLASLQQPSAVQNQPDGNYVYSRHLIPC